MSGPLVLSLFPGIGLLDMAFETEGFTVVRGPDLLWGGDVRRFHPPAGRFDGVIGGPPCRAFTDLALFSKSWKKPPENLIPEFCRVVSEAAPAWFLMENVPKAPLPEIDGYSTCNHLVSDVQCGGATRRIRRFTFGSRNPLVPRLHVEVLALHSPNPEAPATSGHGSHQLGRVIPYRNVTELTRLQGLPADFLAGAPFTHDGKRRVLANGVPLPMGRAVARAVREALGMPLVKQAG